MSKEKLIKSFFQFFPQFRGKIRLSKLLYKKLFKLSTPQKVLAKNNLIFNVPSLIDSIGYELFINGIYERNLVNYLINRLPRNAVFVDVGANIGCISIFIAHHRPDVTIYAFEASPYIFSFLTRNIQENNCKNIFIFNYAVHRENNIELNFYAPLDQFGKGSFNKTYSNQAELVKSITLDSFFYEQGISPDLIKVDVQGFELYVFEGMKHYLSNSNIKPEIVFEFEGWAETIAMGEENITVAQKYLINLGYTIFDFNKPFIPVSDGVISNGSRELIARKILS